MTVAQVRKLQDYLASLTEWMIQDNLDGIGMDGEDVTIHTHHSVDSYVDRIKPDGSYELAEDKVQA